MSDTRPTCWVCNGSGEDYGETCLQCGGQGRTPYRDNPGEDDDGCDCDQCHCARRKGG